MFRHVLLLVFFCFSSPVFSYTLEMTEAQIQEKVSAMMPLKRKQFFVTVTLSNPKVVLIKDSNRMGIYLNVEALIPGISKGEGRGWVTGSISYNTSKGAFYLNEARIETLEIDNLAPVYSDKVKQLAQTVVTKAMAQYPVYQFDEQDMQQKFAKAMLESVEVKDERLRVTLSLF